MIAATRVDGAVSQTPSLTRIAEIAFSDGLAAALGSLPPTRETPSSRMFGWMLVPAGDVDPLAKRPGREPLAASRIAALEGLNLVPGEPTPAIADARTAGLSLHLLALRVGLTRRMLGIAIEHLRGRMSDGLPIIDRQLVHGSVAEIAAAVEICSQAINAAGAADAAMQTDWMHDRLDRADSLVVAMFGAAGFLLDHPVRCLHVVALLRDLWDPGGQVEPPC